MCDMECSRARAASGSHAHKPASKGARNRDASKLAPAAVVEGPTKYEQPMAVVVPRRGLRMDVFSLTNWVVSIKD